MLNKTSSPDGSSEDNIPLVIGKTDLIYRCVGKRPAEKQTAQHINKSQGVS